MRLMPDPRRTGFEMLVAIWRLRDFPDLGGCFLNIFAFTRNNVVKKL